MKKARQLAGTVEKVTRDPQPAGAPLSAPATAVHTVVVPGGQFPVNPVTTRFIDEQLRADPTVAAMLKDPRVLGLQVLDLRDLEHAEAVRARDHRTLPELLRDWQADPRYAQVSPVGLAACHRHHRRRRPPAAAAARGPAGGGLRGCRGTADPTRRAAAPAPTRRAGQ